MWPVYNIMKKSLKNSMQDTKDENTSNLLINLIPVNAYKELKFSSNQLEKDAILLTGEIGRMEGRITFKK